MNLKSRVNSTSEPQTIYKYGIGKLWHVVLVDKVAFMIGQALNIWSQMETFNPPTANHDYSHHLSLATCYQLAQSIL